MEGNVRCYLFSDSLREVVIYRFHANPKPGFIYRKNNHIAIDCGACFRGARRGSDRVGGQASAAEGIRGCGFVFPEKESGKLFG